MAELEILIKANDQATKVLKGIQGRIQGMSKGLKIAGAAMAATGAGITAIGISSIKTFAEMGDEVQKLALKTGFSTEALSEWRHIAEISGASLGALGKGVKTMASFMFDAEKGLSTQKDALDALGLTLDEFEGLEPEETFKKFAEAIAEVEDPMMRSALAEDVFGRAGVQLLPMLAEGKEGMAALAQEAHDLGIVFDQEMADKAAGVTDAMHRMKESIMGVKIAIADHLIPVIKPLIDRVAAIFKAVSAWADENPVLFRTITLVTGVVGLLMVPLGAFLIMLPLLAGGVGILGGAITLLLGPVGLVIIAIIALIAVGVLIWKNWDTIVKWAKTLWEWMGKLKDTIIDLAKQGFDFLMGKLEGIIGAFEDVYNWISKVISGSGLTELNDTLGISTRKFDTLTSSVKGLARSYHEAELAQVRMVGSEATIAFGSTDPGMPLFLHKGETVTPAGGRVTHIHVNLVNGRELAEIVLEEVGGELSLQGVD